MELGQHKTKIGLVLRGKLFGLMYLDVGEEGRGEQFAQNQQFRQTQSLV